MPLCMCALEKHNRQRLPVALPLQEDDAPAATAVRAVQTVHLRRLCTICARRCMSEVQTRMSPLRNTSKKYPIRRIQRSTPEKAESGPSVYENRELRRGFIRDLRDLQPLPCLW